MTGLKCLEHPGMIVEPCYGENDDDRLRRIMREELMRPELVKALGEAVMHAEFDRPIGTAKIKGWGHALTTTATSLA